MTSPSNPILGPKDRTTFFEEQARNRRQSVRFALFSGLTVALTGIPLSILVTPALFLVTLTIAHLVELQWRLPRPIWDTIAQAGRILPLAIGQIGEAIETKSLAGIDWGTFGIIGGSLVVPGMVVMLVLWFWVRLVFSRAGTTGVLLRIGARRPNEQDGEEKQLVNLIEEMAIAGGVKPPQVMLLDTPAVNAAAVGVDIDNATIVITRGLLDRLDRDETQGVIAHLIGSVGNGDLKILSLVFSVFQTMGLLGIMLQSAGSRGARQKLWRTFGSVFHPGDQARTERAAEDLLTETPPDTTSGKLGCLGSILLPIAFAGVAVQLIASLAAWLLFGPPITAMWRRRRLLADATAVQLTRNPDGIAHALERLTQSEVEFDQGRRSRILFLHWPSYSGGATDLAQSGRFHPDLWTRIHRLRAAGAPRLARPDTDDAPAHRRALWVKPFVWLFYGLFGVVMVFGVAACIAAGVLVGVMSLGMMGVALLVIHSLFNNLPAISHFIQNDVPKIARALWGLATVAWHAVRS